MDRAVIKWLLYRDILLMVVHYDLYNLGVRGFPQAMEEAYQTDFKSLWRSKANYEN